jgi:hypothetical protein
MLSNKTFRRMACLSNLLEQDEDNKYGCFSQSEEKQDLSQTINNNYEIVKVNEPETKNYHFELHPKYEPK